MQTSKLQAEGLPLTTTLSNTRHDTFLLLTKRDFGIYGFLRRSSDKLSKLKLSVVENAELIQASIEVGVTHRLLNFEALTLLSSWA